VSLFLSEKSVVNVEQANWIRRRSAEIIVFLIASVAIWVLFDRFARLESLLAMATALFFVYGVVFLYLPLSAGLWFVMRGADRTRLRRLADSALFIAHSYISISVMHDGLLGVDREPAILATSTSPWLAVIGLHLCLISYVLVMPKQNVAK
jgi:hypothetical protein